MKLKICNAKYWTKYCKENVWNSHDFKMNTFLQNHNFQQNIAISNLNLDIRLIALKKGLRKMWMLNKHTENKNCASETK